MITAFGITYQTVADAEARWNELERINTEFEPSDDRVTEQNALREGIAIWEAAQAEGMVEEQADVWTVDKNEYSVPCEHPLCDQLHQRFMTTQTFEGWTSGLGVAVWAKQTMRFHDRNVSEWVILHNGERATEPGLDDVFDTKRDALAVLKRRGLL